MDVDILPAGASDVTALAEVHTESWRSAYRGLLPDAYLDGPILEDRRRFWARRMSEPVTDRRLVLKATDADTLVGFVCAALDVDPTWGARIENLHVAPSRKGEGIGLALFESARGWITQRAPGQPMHLWVLEGNVAARRFYERQGGVVADRKVIDVTDGIAVPEVRYTWTGVG